MSLARIKTLIIILLLIVNVALATLYLTRAGADRASDLGAKAEIAEILARSGIAIDEKIIPSKNPDMAQVEIRRITSREAEIASVLLPGCTSEDRGGGIYMYSSPSGWIEFRGGGYVEAFFSSPPEFAADLEGAKALLAAMGADSPGAPVEGDHDKFTLKLSRDSFPVFNSYLELYCNSSGFYRITGRWTFGEEKAYAGASVRAPATMLLRFADSVRGGGVTGIRSIETGYISIPASPDSASLIPVWRIETNTGPIHFNMRTCAVESA